MPSIQNQNSQLIYTACLNKRSSTKSCKWFFFWITPDSSKPLLFRSLPTTFQNNAKSWLCLFPQVKQERCLASNFLMNRWNAPRKKRWRNFTNDMRPAGLPKRWYRDFWCLAAGNQYGRHSRWRGSSAKGPARRFCYELNVVVYGLKYGTALWPPACGCQRPLVRAKHVDLEREPEKELSKNLAKKRTKNLQNFHLIMYMAKKSDEPAYAPAETQKQVLSKVPPWNNTYCTEQRELPLEQPMLVLTPFVPREPFLLHVRNSSSSSERTILSKESQDSAYYRLSVSIWISSKSCLSRNFFRQS